MTDQASEAARTLAPSGTLRAALNFGNTVLAQRDGATGEPRGVSTELARELARRLDLPLTFVPFEQAGDVFGGMKRQAWDIAFLAIEPARAAEIDFTAPYVLIEGVYVVSRQSEFQSAADIDRAGNRIAVEKGSAYDLYLTRTLEHATLVYPQLAGQSALDLDTGRANVLAGVKQLLEPYVSANQNTRMIPEPFMAIRQAMGTPRGREAGARYLRSFIEEMKSSGFVAAALKATGQAGAQVAPAEPIR